MNPWFGYGLIIAANTAGIVIRIPHDKKNSQIRVVDSRKGSLEKFLLFLMGVALFILPILVIATPFLSFADYSFSRTSFVLGAICVVLNLWLFYRSHQDLGENWSATLEVRENHQLVCNGIYRAIRHPMYASIYLLVLAQALLIPNWIVGPAGLIAFTLMFVFRLKPEEQMMIDQFGAEYVEYAAKTKRLIPGVW
jgi:protein-S-isoprenylcysteine O-methyltransferase Ste14